MDLGPLRGQGAAQGGRAGTVEEGTAITADAIIEDAA